MASGYGLRQWRRDVMPVFIEMRIAWAYMAWRLHSVANYMQLRYPGKWN